MKTCTLGGVHLSGLILFSIEFSWHNILQQQKNGLPLSAFSWRNGHSNASATQEMEREDEDGLMKAGPES